MGRNTTVRLANLPAFQRSLIDIFNHSRRPVEETMRKQAKLVVEKVLQVTPPANGFTTGKQAQAMGKRTVAAHINKVLIGVPVITNRRALQKVTESQIARHHNKQRVRGRVGRVNKKMKLVVPINKLKRYTKAKQKGVGMLMAGWNKAASGLGVTRGHQAWVRKHNPPSTFKFKSNNRRLHIKFSNRVRYVGTVRVMESRLNIALRKQAHANDKIIHAYKRSARNLGFKVS